MCPYIVSIVKRWRFLWLSPDLLPRWDHQSARQRQKRLQQKRQEHHPLWWARYFLSEEEDWRESKCLLRVKWNVSLCLLLSGSGLHGGVVLQRRLRQICGHRGTRVCDFLIHWITEFTFRCSPIHRMQTVCIHHWPMIPHSFLFWDLRVTVFKILIPRRNIQRRTSNLIRN